MAATYFNLIDANLCLGRMDDAQVHSKKLTTLCRMFGEKFACWSGRTKTGQIAHAIGELDVARKAFDDEATLDPYATEYGGIFHLNTARYPLEHTIICRFCWSLAMKMMPGIYADL